jgi:predicted DNA-binding transcriptional regulator AlpA
MSNNGVTTEKLLTAQAIAEKLSLSKRQIFRMKSAGLICAPIKVGAGSIRWRASDVEQWISMGCCNQQEFKARREAGKC